MRKTASPSLVSSHFFTAGCHSAIAHYPPKHPHSAFASSSTFLGSTLTSSFLPEARLAASAVACHAKSAQQARTAQEMDFIVPPMDFLFRMRDGDAPG